MDTIKMEQKIYLKMYCNNKVILKPGKYFIFSLLFITFVTPSFSQEQRLTDKNKIAWFVYTGNFKIKPKVAIHSEYQLRREDGLKNPQQFLLRTGVNYTLAKDLSLIAGYAFAKTFPYGDYPNASSVPEHRIFEQVTIKNTVGKVDLSHRFTLEQRFVGKVLLQNGIRHTEYTFLNRLRYRLRTEAPLKKNVANKNNLTIIFQDEVFIGWGRNIGVNVFDQNRLAVLLGYKLNQNVKIEAGYLNQILQQGKRVNDKAVFQYNNGFILAAHLSFDFLK